MDESFGQQMFDQLSPLEQESKVDDEEQDKFAFQWVSAVGRGTILLYTQKIMEIPNLSEMGCRQLVTDIGEVVFSILRLNFSGYLVNLLSALGVPIDANLEVILKYLRAKDRSASFLVFADAVQK